ncbi:MAG: hypothetical protein BGN99_24250 [Alphaproteobacteria bacterium 65-37]|jgi:hypothetical protein|nr:MAG: hypothetical protein BGN99_24250 [Alphaproteobacteria bacterium 65-37]
MFTHGMLAGLSAKSGRKRMESGSPLQVIPPGSAGQACATCSRVDLLDGPPKKGVPLIQAQPPTQS